MAGWKLGALLTELREGRLHDTSNQVAGASDYLWSDSRLVSYINESVRRFARRSLVIRDESSSITRFTTVNGQSLYSLDPSIVSVLSVRMAGDHTDLARAGHDGFDTYHEPDAYFFDPNFLDSVIPGKALAFSTDESFVADPNGSFGTMVLRLFPVIATPYDNIVAQMRVIREPIHDLVLSNLNAYPEIPPAYHLDILDWAAYLALSTVDTDVAGEDAAVRAEKFHDRFEVTCRDAKHELLRKAQTPLQWGFGNNGWSWETNP